jgi:hypothetical protein
MLVDTHPFVDVALGKRCLGRPDLVRAPLQALNGARTESPAIVEQRA